MAAGPQPTSDDPSPLPAATRIAFAGTPAFAARILRALLDAQIPIGLVLTQPDRPSGRKRRLTSSPVKDAATTADIALHQPKGLRLPKNRARLEAFAPDLLIVAAYGLILPPAVLSLPQRGCVNVHASLLPRWRGAAPIERAIMAGDRETGVTLMQMDEGLDTGSIVATATTAITDSSTGGTLTTQLADQGATLLIQALPGLLAGSLTGTPQPGVGVTYAAKLTRADGELDWTQPAALVARRIQALTTRMPVEVRLAPDRVKLLTAFAAASPAATRAPPGTIIGFGNRPADQPQLPKTVLYIQCGGVDPHGAPGGAAIAVTSLLIATRGKGKAIDAAAAQNGFGALFEAGRVCT